MGMSRLTVAEVDRAAALARIRLDDAERVELTAELNAVLRQVEALRAVDVSDVPPLPAAGDPGPEDPAAGHSAHPVPLAYPLAAVAPAWEHPFVLVPRLPLEGQR